MQTVEYRRWAPPASPVSVEFPADLFLELGWSERSGALYGSRRGREVRLTVCGPQTDEEKADEEKEKSGEEEEKSEQEKVGVFISRIRGEVFLTEGDLAFLDERRAGLALVVAGDRAGFFVRETDGAIQTVRSHEEFSVPRAGKANPPATAERSPRRARISLRTVAKWALPVLVLAMVALAALARLPAAQTPRSVALHEVEHQLRISWEPAQTAVLTIYDGAGRVSIPVYANQSTATYAMRGPEVDVSLVSMDPPDRGRRVSAHYAGAALAAGR
jgi:hypothetical protein